MLRDAGLVLKWRMGAPVAVAIFVGRFLVHFMRAK